MTLPLGMAGQPLEGDSHRPSSDRFGGLKVVGGKTLQKGWIQDEEAILHSIREQLKYPSNADALPGCKGGRNLGHRRLPITF